MSDPVHTQDKENKVQLLVAEFNCQECSSKVRTLVPQMCISNFRTYSSIGFSHEKPIQCTNCKTLYIPLLASITKNLELKLIWKELKKVGEPKVDVKPAVAGVQ